MHIMKGEKDMEKIKLDWKAPSERKMKDIVAKMDDSKKKEFAETCIFVDENGKKKMNKAKAKHWLIDNCPSDVEIEWKNKPSGDSKRGMSAVDIVASWLDLE